MAAARHLLSQLSGTEPEAVPLRLNASAGALISALPQRLASRGMNDPRALAEVWAASAKVRAPFQSITASGGVLVLTLSEQWLRSVLERYGQKDWPRLESPWGVRRCDRAEAAFLLNYTARRCRTLAQRDEVLPALPRSLVCLLAGDAPNALAVAQAFWTLPPEDRRDRDLARAVGMCAARAAVFTKNSPPSPEGRL